MRPMSTGYFRTFSVSVLFRGRFHFRNWFQMCFQIEKKIATEKKYTIRHRSLMSYEPPPTPAPLPAKILKCK